MKFGTVHVAILLISYFVFSVWPWSHFGKEKKYTEAELNFPGVSDLAIKKNSDDTIALISTWTGHLSRVVKFIPGAEALSRILAAVSVMAKMLKAAETEVGKFGVDESLGVHAILDIQSKLVTIENLLTEIWENIETGQRFYMEPLTVRNACEEILQKFSQVSSYLYKGNNCDARTSPDLRTAQNAILYVVVNSPDTTPSLAIAQLVERIMADPEPCPQTTATSPSSEKIK